MAETIAAQKAKEPSPPQNLAKKPETSLEHVQANFDDISRRAFEFFEHDGRISGRDLDHWFRAERELLHPVHIELTENDTAYAIKAEVPGFIENELEISVEPHRVVIAGKRETRTTEEEEGKVIRSETSSEQVLRIVELPGPVETGKATATLLKNGILTLNLPKVPAAATVRIKPVAT
jgi:HSP20 family protein